MLVFQNIFRLLAALGLPTIFNRTQHDLNGRTFIRLELRKHVGNIVERIRGHPRVSANRVGVVLGRHKITRSGLGPLLKQVVVRFFLDVTIGVKSRNLFFHNDDQMVRHHQIKVDEVVLNDVFTSEKILTKKPVPPRMIFQRRQRFKKLLHNTQSLLEITLSTLGLRISLSIFFRFIPRHPNFQERHRKTAVPVGLIANENQHRSRKPGKHKNDNEKDGVGIHA